MIRLAAYALLRRGPDEPYEVVGFETVEEARDWQNTHDNWAEFCWDHDKFQEWRVKVGLKAMPKQHRLLELRKT